MFASDRDRERAAGALREHYALGRLTLDEFSERVGSVLAARSRADVRGSLSGLPLLPDLGGLAARAQLGVQVVLRGAVLMMLTGAYFVFSFLLLFALGLTLLLHGASGAVLIGFLIAWLAPTYLVARLWRRAVPGRLRP